MFIWGKLFGSLFGYLMGNLPGAMIGLLLGHLFDHSLKKLSLEPIFYRSHILIAQQAFFKNTFLIMGYLAKADGRVSEREIAVAEHAMRQMHLDAERKRFAIELFRQGKQPGFDPDLALDEFQTHCGQYLDLVRMFIQIQVGIVVADGTVAPQERKILDSIAYRFGLAPRELDGLIRLYLAGMRFRSPHEDVRSELQDAYAVLGVSEQASNEEVKIAYRKMMNQHHPDKLVAKGLPKEMVELATEKTQEIKKAYDLIKNSRQS